jgi:oligopeptide transport system ATP-binding protein
LSVEKHMAHRIAVMYLGKIVELGEAKEVFESPLHPYTQALIHAVPLPDPVWERSRGKDLLSGEIPSPMHPPQGCAFHPRCPHVTAACREEVPVLRDCGGGHEVACLRVEEIGSAVKV